MHQINPRKLRLSKWTSLLPQKKEKHFIVTKLLYDDQENVIECVIEAVLTHQEYTLSWHDLKSAEHWQQGWH
ncbi:MAG: TIGR02450 family Trp-rich protein [Marinomonas sp.]